LIPNLFPPRLPSFPSFPSVKNHSHPASISLHPLLHPRHPRNPRLKFFAIFSVCYFGYSLAALYPFASNFIAAASDPLKLGAFLKLGLEFGVSSTVPSFLIQSLFH
jgi:hypothetical protein